VAQGYIVGLPQRLFTAAGLPAVGWKITTYVAGTVTPLVTYSNPTLTSANLATIITDNEGYFRCYVGAGVLVKFAVTDENDVPQADLSFDNLEPMVDISGSNPSVTAVPTGGIIAYGASSAPSGFLLCNGALVSRSTFSALFAVIGVSYGAGDGLTTFAVPDYRGRYPMGVAAAGTGNTLGATFGTIDHTHTGPSHTHGATLPRDGWGSTLTTPSTTGRLNVGNAAGVGQFSSSYQPTGDQSITTAAGGTGATGTANPPTLTCYWIIKT
jgi:microcystin-dependent protein